MSRLLLLLKKLSNIVDRAVQGQKKGKPLVMEAICDPELYIWYYNVENPKSLNDINILDRSSIIGSVISQDFNTKAAEYSINRIKREYMYFLATKILIQKLLSIPLMEQNENTCIFD